jgi:LAS superfamily LD-carboxypeptidase LdcB
MEAGHPMSRAAPIAIAVLALSLLGHVAEAKPVTGYSNGAKTTIETVEIGKHRVEVHTAKAFRAMAKAARKAHLDLAIRSAYRSLAKQAKLYAEYRHGDGNLAAPPGYSNHESGRALDLVVTNEKVYAWLREHAAIYGFHRTVPGEAWHWEYLRGTEAATARVSAPGHAKHRSRPSS